MKKRFFIFLTLALLAGSAPAWASELYGTIWYKGEPLKNAEITVQDKTLKTNAKGYYSVQLDPGGYTLKIKLPDGKVKEAKVEVFPQDTEKNLKVE